MSLWLQSTNPYESHSPTARIYKVHFLHKETSLNACRRGSLTLEAVVVIPLVIGFLVTLLNFFRVLQVQEAVEEAIAYAGRKTAAEASVVSDETALLLSAEGFLLAELHNHKGIENYVEGGVLGISLLGSACDGEEIALQATYSVRLPVSFFGMDSLRLGNQGCFRKWIGSQPPAQEGEHYVYITPTGEVYHERADCRTIKLSIHEIAYGEMGDLLGSDGQKYDACPVCVGSKWVTGNVYYTEHGILYHCSLECRYLKRTVDKVPLSEVTDRRPCLICGGEGGT